MKNKSAMLLGKLGGKASVKKRFDGKTKEEISEIMRAVRLTSPQKKQVDRMATESLEALKKATTK